MKILITTTLITILLVSCSKEDDPLVLNKFGIGNTDYSTTNAFLILDDGPVFTNAFAFAFLDSILVEDNINGSSISTITTQAAFMFVRLGSNRVNSESDVTNNISNTVYNLDDNSAVLTNITNYSDTYTAGGIMYGAPEESSAMLYEIDDTGNGTISIISFAVDLAARTGTIHCNYSLTDDNNVMISGSYNGSFGIINEF